MYTAYIHQNGLAAYVSAIRQLFRISNHTGKRGRPQLRLWQHLCIVQVIKQRAQKQPRQVIGVLERIVCGTVNQVKT